MSASKLSALMVRASLRILWLWRGVARDGEGLEEGEGAIVRLVEIGGMTTV